MTEVVAYSGPRIRLAARARGHDLACFVRALRQPLGAAWYQRQTAVILRVPSSIIAYEHNYVLNTRHPDFAQGKIVGWEGFEFDPRIKDF